MLEVAVYNTEGEKIDTMQVDETLLGGEVNADLVKQAVVTYEANARQGSAATRSRGMVAGSTKKLFRQKGTGNARRGAIRTNVLRGGGVAFAKTPKSWRKKLPKKMRKAALKSAVLAKILGEDLIVLDGLSIEEPKTRTMADIVKKLGINRSCLLTIGERNKAVYLSSRNIPDLTVRITDELNARDVAVRQKMVITTDAMKAMIGQED
ncbi:MAG: 50S ribosomal protein L4 [Phycisphaerae bacterium]